MKPDYSTNSFWLFIAIAFIVLTGGWSLVAPSAFDLTAGEAIISGLIFSVLACGGYTLLRFTAGKIIEKSISTNNPQFFFQSIKDELEKLKYGLVKQEGDDSLWTCRDPGWDMFLEKVYVEIKDTKAILTGPKRIIKKLITRF